MGDQKNYEEYRQKLQQYWTAFLTFCGRVWEIVRAGAQDIWTFLYGHCRGLTQRISAWAFHTSQRDKARWENFKARVREKLKNEDSFLGRAGVWCGGVIARFQSPKAALPEAQAVSAEEPAAAEAVEEPAPAVETDPVPVVALPEPEPVTAAAEAPVASQNEVPVAQKIGDVFRAIGKWIRRLYKIVMAAPVVYAAVKLALDNADRLPDLVGLDIQSTGEFSYVVTRQIAVLGPLAVTAFCLVLMFLAKKPLLPWVISIFTLVLPILIWVTNYYA